MKKATRKKPPQSQASEGIYRSLFKHHPVPLWVYDLETLAFLDVNDAALAKYGYAREEFMAMTIKDIRPAEDVPRLLMHLGNRSSGLRHSGEWRHKLKDGSIIIVEITSHPLKYLGRNAVLVSVQDITERKQTERDILQLTDRFRAFLDITIEGLVFHEKGLILDVNPALVRMFGYSNESELIGRTIAEFVVPQFRNDVMKRIVSGDTRPYETKALRKDGTTFSMVASPSTYSYKGKIVRVASIRDITERLHHEEELRLSEEKYRKIFENIQDVFYQVDLQGRLTNISPSIQRYSEYAPADLIGEPVATFYDNPADREVFFRDLRKKGEVTDYILKLRTKSGREVYVSTNAHFIFDADGRPAGVEGTMRDVTAHRRALEALKNSEERFRSVWESSIDGMRITDKEGIILAVNGAFCDIMQMTKEELEGQVFTVAYKPTDDFHRTAMREYKNNFSARSISPKMDVPLFLRSGSEVIVETSNAFLESESEGPLLLSIFRDITMRKNAEKALSESEYWFKESQRVGRIGSYFTDFTTGRWQSSEVLDEIFGIDAEFDRSIEGWAAIVHPVHRNEMIDYLGHIIAHQMPFEKEYRINRVKDGAERWVAGHGRLTFDETGKPLTMIGTIQDVTDRKNAEEVLRESNTFNELLVKTMPFGIDIVNEQGDLLYMSDKMKLLVGFDAVGRRCWSAYKDDKQQCHDCPLREEIDFSKAKQLESTGVLGGRTFQISHIGMMYQGKKAMLEVFEDITDRRDTERALRQSEERYRTLFEDSKDIVYISTPEGKLIDINPAGVDLLGYTSKQEMLNIDIATSLFALPEQRTLMRQLLQEQGFIKNYEEVLLRKDGKAITVLDTATAVRDVEGHAILFRGIMRDVTKEKQLEAQLVQIQKLESIGTLASGIAHDFNNILAIILGYTTLLERDPQNLSKSIASIQAAVSRGTGLVRQILTFARKTEVVYEPIDVNVMVKELVKMLQQTFPKTIEVLLHLGRDLPLITADVTQLHQAVLNLCVNARDAMPTGGTLSIRTDVVYGNALSSVFPNIPSAPFLRINVTDTGIGMDEQTRSQVFDPFFTTKEKGKGTGLGLSVVYGIMQAHQGYVDVKGSPGQGSEFNLYFPIPKERGAQGNKSSRRELGALRGHETLLFVEDEEGLSTYVQSALEDHGYKVLAATDGAMGFDMYRTHAAAIDLVLTDIGLPKMSGEVLFAEIKKLNPGAKIILASGYIEPSARAQLIEAGADEIIQKPYAADELLEVIRKVLDK